MVPLEKYIEMRTVWSLTRATCFGKRYSGTAAFQPCGWSELAPAARSPAMSVRLSLSGMRFSAAGETAHEVRATQRWEDAQHM